MKSLDSIVEFLVAEAADRFVDFHPNRFCFSRCIIRQTPIGSRSVNVDCGRCSRMWNVGKVFEEKSQFRIGIEMADTERCWVGLAARLRSYQRAMTYQSDDGFATIDD